MELRKCKVNAVRENFLKERFVVWGRGERDARSRSSAQVRGEGGDERFEVLGGGLGGGAGTQAEAGAKSAYALGAVTTAGLLAEASQTANTVSLAAVTDGQNGQNSENGGQGSQDGAGQNDQNTQGENGQETPSGQGTQSDALKEEVARFGEYFEMLDTFLDEGALNVQVTENTDTSYAFSTKLTVEGTLPDGQTVVYTMYYTETEAGMREEQDEDEYEVRIAYVLKKEDLTRALFVLQKALEAYPGRVD